jgi:DNA-directed RNA polymerase subunit beta'
VLTEYLGESYGNAPEFTSIRVRLASPEKIREWSHGEVTLPETINYRSFKPEKGGLFCERIFGPVKDWECNCGKYKRIRYRGVVCENCGVEVTQAKVRRERMGHIELAVPVAHIWFFRGIPNVIGRLLDIKRKDLERILYYESYVVLDPGTTDLEVGELLSGERMAEYRESIPESGLVAEMGAGAIKTLLSRIDVLEEHAKLKSIVRDEKCTKQMKRDALKRLYVYDAFMNSGNRPEWMIMDVLPVLPPDLRPLVPLEGGRFATSDLNDLYRRVIYRNNRLANLLRINAPDIILRNEKRMLQQAVDALFDNGRGSRAVRGRGRRVLKSLSHLLKGKKGRFRQNLLGKRVDYSGRSVIVVGPELKLHQCGLPKTMALELFNPFIMRKLQEKGFVQTVKSAKKLVEKKSPEVWDILDEVIDDHPVLLNRAPTLHRLGIQAFEPVLVEGKAIRIHPLVCAAFNADFDGDQMAVHVPLSFEAQLESRILMLSPNNVLLPADGKPIAAASQDIVLGCHYLTREEVSKEEKRIPAFVSKEEVLFALDYKKVRLHQRINLRLKGKIVTTTPGRVIFNSIFPEEIPFQNRLQSSSTLKTLIGLCYTKLGQDRTVQVLDRLKDLGFEYATLAGMTVGIDDIVTPEKKKSIVESTDKDVAKIYEHYEKGIITDTERYNRVVDIWTHATSQVADAMAEALEKHEKGFNPIHMMAASGARGSKDQIRQLAGMRGLMAKPQKRLTGQRGEIIESPIKSNFKEGLTALEYFISTHGARKGLADTALKTADAGYLTRRLVDVAQDAVITEEDCGTVRGREVMALMEAEKIVEPLHERVLGRVASKDIVDPATGEVICKADDIIDEKVARAIDDLNIEKAEIRTVLTCESKRGLCGKCYGWNLASGRMVNVGEAVGIIAAQSIGEPGTQLTLRTFHIGGTAGRIAEESTRASDLSGEVETVNMTTRKNAQDEVVVVSRRAQIRVASDDNRRRSYNVPYGAKVLVGDGETVEEGDHLFYWDPYNEPVVSTVSGAIQFEDIVMGRTAREVVDETTGHRELVISDDPMREMHAKLVVIGKGGRRLTHYDPPTGARLSVVDGQEVSGGEILAKIPREFAKTRDITGGLPRVEELFEARAPKNPATVTEIDGIVKFGTIKRGTREMEIIGEKESRVYKLPHGAHLLVQDGDSVKAGDKLSEGPINPHDILSIKGEKAVQEYLLNETQEVYRLQGVRINDKHIGIIVRQMLQKVKVTDPGDTRFLEGDVVSRVEFEEENRRIIEENKELPTSEKKTPAKNEALLLGITKAALKTESFISAASFQETTRVLMGAAIQGKSDSLLGLKENVIIGHLIPAGTGSPYYRNVQMVNVYEEDQEEEIEAGSA